MNEKHYAQMYSALKRIRRYEAPERLRKSSERQYGIGGDEAIEMAYENVLQEAKNGLRGVRKPPAPKPPPMPLHPVTLTESDIAALCGGKRS